MPWRAEFLQSLTALIEIMAPENAGQWWENVADLKKAGIALFAALAMGATGGTVFTAGVITHYSSLQQVPGLVDRMDRADAERAQIMDRVDALVCELRADRTGELPAECDDRILR